MFMVLKETYSQCNTYPNANGFVWQIFKNSVNFCIKPQKIHDGWKKLEKEEKIGPLSSGFKMGYQTTVIKGIWNCHKERDLINFQHED